MDQLESFALKAAKRKRGVKHGSSKESRGEEEPPAEYSTSQAFAGSPITETTVGTMPGDFDSIEAFLRLPCTDESEDHTPNQVPLRLTGAAVIPNKAERRARAKASRQGS